MAEPTLKKTHELLEKLADYVMNEVPKKSETDKLAEYVMNEVPRKDEVPTRSKFEKLAEYVMNDVINKKELEIRLGEVRLEIEKRIQKVEEQLDEKANKKDIQMILNGMDAMAKNLDDIRIEQKAFISV